jgi:hypothetical protein
MAATGDTRLCIDATERLAWLAPHRQEQLARRGLVTGWCRSLLLTPWAASTSIEGRNGSRPAMPSLESRVGLSQRDFGDSFQNLIRHLLSRRVGDAGGSGKWPDRREELQEPVRHLNGLINDLRATGARDSRVFGREF